MALITCTPLDVPVDMDAPFDVERDLTLDTPGRYGLYLAFDRRDASFARLRDLIGGTYGQKIEVNEILTDANEPPGLAIPIKWELQTNTETVAEEQSLTLGAHLWSEAEVGRLLYCGDFAAGGCKFKARLAKGIPELRNIRCRFRLDRLK